MLRSRLRSSLWLHSATLAVSIVASRSAHASDFTPLSIMCPADATVEVGTILGMTALGELSPGCGGAVSDINAAGQIVGSAYLFVTPYPDYPWYTSCASRAVVFDPSTGAVTDLGTLGLSTDVSSSTALAINELGQIVGGSDQRAFIYDPSVGTMQALPLPEGAYNMTANDIDATGRVVGTVDGITLSDASPGGESWTRGFVYDPATGSTTLLGVLPGGTGSRAFAINDAGLVVGDSEHHPRSGYVEFRPFIYDFATGVMTDPHIADAVMALHPPRGRDNDVLAYYRFGCAPTDINAHGSVAVTCEIWPTYNYGQKHAFIYAPTGGVTELDPSGPFDWIGVTVSALNDHGQAVGSRSSNGARRAYLFDPSTGILDLGALPGAYDSVATSLDARARVVGNSAGLGFVWSEGATVSRDAHVAIEDAIAPGCGQTRTVTRTITATDAAGGVASCVQTIAEVDSVPPAFAFCPAAAQVESTSTTWALIGSIDIWSSARAITDHGAVVGSVGGVAFHYTPFQGMQSLGTLPGGTNSSANDVNEAGWVVGTSNVGDYADHAFAYHPDSGMVELGLLPGGYSANASAINEAGMVAGSSSSDTTWNVAVTWDTTAAVDTEDFRVVLGFLPGGTDSLANGINDRGQVVGRSSSVASWSRAFLWTPDAVVGDAPASAMVDLGTLPGGDTAEAYGINNRGQVVGRSSGDGFWGHAFLWDPELGMRDLGTLVGGTFSEARAINDRGQVVGVADSQSGTRAFLWDPGQGLIDLGALPGGDTAEASDISSAGQIVGAANTYAGGLSFAALYDPADITCGADVTTATRGMGDAVDPATGTVSVVANDAITRGCEASLTIVRTFVGSDGCNIVDDCVQTIEVVDTTPPPLECPPDVTVECGGDVSPTATGYASADDTCSDSIAVSHEDAFARGPGGAGVVTRTWVATDTCGNATQCLQHITLVDTTAPQVSDNFTPRVLWPPNHDLVELKLVGQPAFDRCDLAIGVFESLSAVSSEPDDAVGNGDGSTRGDIRVRRSGAVLASSNAAPTVFAAPFDPSKDWLKLRAERGNQGTGRNYTVTVSARDAAGNVATRTFTVRVPRHQGH